MLRTATRQFSTSVGRNKAYGFIGLGRMGLPMCQNLVKGLTAEDKITVHDPAVKDIKLESLSTCPVTIADSPGEVALQSDIVFSMLKEPVNVSTVYQDILAAIAGARPKTFVDCSTIDVATSLRTAWSMSSNGGHTFIDAPVAGNVHKAKTATLTFMVGADNKISTLDQASWTHLRQVLETMGSKVVMCGAPGMGLVAKLCNNYMLAITNMATCEAFQIARSLGLDLNLFTEIVNSSTGRSWSTMHNNPVPGFDPTVPSSNNYDNGFYISHMAKDLSLALDAAEQANVHMLLGNVTLDAYQTIEKTSSFKTKDVSAVYKYLDQK